MFTVRGNQIVTGWLFPGTYLLKTLSVHSFKSLRQRSCLKLWLHCRLARLTVFCEIDAKLRNHHIIRISNVQLILRNCEIISVCYRDFPCSVDFAKLRNQFSLLSECPLFSWFCETAKLRNPFSLLSEFPMFSWFCEIAKLRNQFSLCKNKLTQSCDCELISENCLDFISAAPLCQ